MTLHVDSNIESLNLSEGALPVLDSGFSALAMISLLSFIVKKVFELSKL